MKSDLNSGHLELTPMDVAGRLGRLRNSFDAFEIDALVVTNSQNIRYLSGFNGSAGTMFVSSDKAWLFTDGRYRDQAPQQISDSGAFVEVEILASDHLARVSELVSLSQGTARVGFESEQLSFAAATGLISALGESASVPTNGVVESLRILKDDGELSRMAAAASVTDAALAQTKPLLETGISERDFGISLDTALRRLGATSPSFETIVASGPNGALPHARPSGRIIGAGELVVIDVGSIVDGYCSDMTRTLYFGDLAAEPTRALNVVAAAQAAGVAAARPGVEAVEVDEACRDVIADAGWAEYFNHGTGHGVGLDVHEQPRISSRSGDTLAPGQVITVEPGVYLPGRCGARIEDSLVITDDGHRALTLAPKNLPT